MEDLLDCNAEALQKELNWLRLLINTRLQLAFGQECEHKNVFEVLPPEPNIARSPYHEFIKKYRLNFSERALLILSLAPHTKPEILDAFYIKNADYDKNFTEFGGVIDSGHSGFLPTGETALFLLAGGDLKGRLRIQELFDSEHLFAKRYILRLETDQKQGSIPLLSGRLVLQQEYIDRFTLGKMRKPDYNSNFPAKLVTTELEWEEVVLNSGTMEQVMEIKDWIEFGPSLMNNMGLRKKLKPGYQCLFYGPPGTGKTLTACLLGKTTKRDVYRIDLSMVVSKYIGETEKNLAKIFDMAEHKDWILFFDEADALFGKRTEVQSSHDRYANQEVAYLLQRIEDFGGIVVLASNLKENLDEAFTRRFQSIIHFPLPSPGERYKIWQKAFSEKMKLEERVDLKVIAARHEISGGVIMNVVKYASIKAMKRKDATIQLFDLEAGIKREFQKSGILLI